MHPLSNRVSAVGHMDVAGGWPKLVKRGIRACSSGLWKKQ
jgi:hypothetical protein